MVNKLFSIVFFIGLTSPGTVAVFNGLAQAVTFTVTNTNDSGDGSLREAIASATASLMKTVHSG